MATNPELPARFKLLSDEAIATLKGRSGDEREEVLREARRLIQQLQTPAEYAANMIWAPVELATAAAACDMGIFHSMAQSDKAKTTTAEITHSSKSDDNGLIQRIVHSLAAHGMIDQIDDQHYRPNDITKDFASSARHGSVMILSFIMRTFSALPWLLRKNGYRTPPDLKNCCWQEVPGVGGTMWEWLEQNPEMGKLFNDYMSVEKPYMSKLMDEYPFEKLFDGSTTEDVIFVDVAGGRGHQASSLRESFPRTRGRMIVQDLPQVIEGQDSKHIEFMAHDMMKEQPVKGARAYYFRSVLHDHEDSVCRTFLLRIIEAMDSDSRILVHDAIVEDFMPSIAAVRQDMGMMCLFAGKERTKAQMKALLESVGLIVVATYRAGPEKFSITEARLQ